MCRNKEQEGGEAQGCCSDEAVFFGSGKCCPATRTAKLISFRDGMVLNDEVAIRTDNDRYLWWGTFDYRGAGMIIVRWLFHVESFALNRCCSGSVDAVVELANQGVT